MITQRVTTSARSFKRTCRVCTGSLQATASHEHAEQCFFAGIKDALNECMVLKKWAHPGAAKLPSRMRFVSSRLRPLSRMNNETVGRKQTTDGRRARRLEL